MSTDDKELREEGTAPFARRQGPPRDRPVTAWLTPDERLEVLHALADAGYESGSEGARAVLLSYARNVTAKAA